LCGAVRTRESRPRVIAFSELWGALFERESSMKSQTKLLVIGSLVAGLCGLLTVAVMKFSRFVRDRELEATHLAEVLAHEVEQLKSAAHETVGWSMPWLGSVPQDILWMTVSKAGKGDYVFLDRVRNDFGYKGRRISTSGALAIGAMRVNHWVADESGLEFRELQLGIVFQGEPSVMCIAVFEQGVRFREEHGRPMSKEEVPVEWSSVWRISPASRRTHPGHPAREKNPARG
ncbi:MAG: hypothetical protein AAF581_10545, partial [Planctomycetota bacterium]